MSGEAPAEFALVDEFADPPEEPAVEPPVAEHAIAEPVIAGQAAEPEQPVAVAHEPPTAEVSPIEAAAETVAADAVVSEATPSETATPRTEIQHEPSPYVEAVADEPLPPANEEIPEAEATPDSPTNSTPSAEATSETEESSDGTRRHPLRFMWQMDADGRFTLGSDEFTRLIGAHTAAGFGRPWSEISEHFGLDPEGHVVKAIATRGTWSGITLGLADRRRRPPAGRTVGLADLRLHRKSDRLSRLRHLPRSRRPDPA